MLAFETPKLLVLKAKGTGGVDEIRPLMDDSQVSFFLVRLPDRQKDLVQRGDGKSNTKDIFITWQGMIVCEMVLRRC
jgi:hypothetical protein